MSEASTPSMNLHPISPSSSMSSTDSAPRSEPTSDEQPDLGAFTTVLREWTHLQPGPRIPVQRRAATSSTTPTFQPTEPSVAGSVQSSSYRPTSSYRRRRAPSSQSTFTRPPSSSAQPEEGSTVWDHGLIANYLLSATPSNDYDLDDYYELDPVDEEGESQYNPSPPNSLNSTSLTVEINSESDVPTTDNESHRISPSPHSDRGLAVPVHGPDQRLNSRESHYPLEERTTEDGSTYRNHTSSQNSAYSSGSYSTSLHLQTQAPLSSSSSSGTDVVLSAISTASSVQENQSNAANSQSTTMSNFVSTVMNRSQNPIPPQTVYPSPNVESCRYAPSSTSGSASFTSLSTQRPAQQVLQMLHDSIASPPLLNPHSPQPGGREFNVDQDSSSSLSTYQGVVNDWGTPDQPPSETLLFEPPTARVAQFRPVVDDDDEDLLTTGQPGSSAAGPSSYRRMDATINVSHPPDFSSASSSISGNFQKMGQNFHLEPHNEDDQTDDDLYNHHYPHSHGVTPRYHGSALTPKGLPRNDGFRAGVSASHPVSQSSMKPATQGYDLAHSNASYTQTLPGSTHTQTTQSHPYPQKYVPQQHLYSQHESNNNTASDIRPQHIDAHSFKHPIAPHQPPHSLFSTQSTLSHHVSRPFHDSSSSVPMDHQDQSTSKHGYPHSLLGMHVLPTSINTSISDNSTVHPLVEEMSESSRVQSRLTDFTGRSNSDDHHTQGHSDVDNGEENMPSLGALDEVLEFIAIERERARTNRAAANHRVDQDTDSEEQEDSADEGRDDVGWSNVVDADADNDKAQEQEQGEEEDRSRTHEAQQEEEIKMDKGKEKEVEPEKEVDPEKADGADGAEAEQPRRRRRRKRPSRTHAAAAAALSTDSVGTPSTSAATESPAGRKRRRVRSSSRNAASLLQSQGKEKEFLVNPSTLLKSAEKAKAQVTILRRPPVGLSDDEDNEDPGAKTPTNAAHAATGRVSDMRNRDAFQDRSWQGNEFQSDFEYGQVNQTWPMGDKDEAEGDGEGNETSFSNMPLLQPPRRIRDSAKDTTHIHDVLGGSYRSTPGSPGLLQSYDDEDIQEEVDDFANADGDTPLQDAPEPVNPPLVERKRRPRKSRKAVRHAKSVPDLKNEFEQLEEAPPVATIADPLPGLSRAKSLGKQSQYATLRAQDPFDTQRDQLEMYLGASFSAMPGLFMMERPRRSVPTETLPQPDPDSKRGRLIALAQQLRQSFPEQDEELYKLIMRLLQQHASKLKRKHKKDAAAEPESVEGGNDIGEEEDHIDTRGRSTRRSSVLTHVFIDHSNILIGLLTHIRRVRYKRQKAAMKNPATAFAAVKPNTARPLPLPISGDGYGITVQSSHSYPIPLPSFATSRSLPAKSVLSTYMENREGHLSDEPPANGSISDDYEEMMEGSSKSDEKKNLTHLWHAALVLILERGRDVNRRVVVTSSPLYQPMDSIERLGYDLRVYLRVPDLGDGLDRERQKEKYGAKSSSSNGKNSSAKGDGLGHMRQPSGNASTDSGNDAAAPPRVKYREQGVDELLQLKLHQALIATDIPPDGSTIVLATGDGNTGQFNEDGFLGAVRAALRKGWRVELYSWEYGLSSSWRREFGEYSRRGMFRIIFMEQFASSLLEANTLL